MPSAPVNKLKKQEINWLYANYCRHGHRYIDHFNCFISECLDGQEWQPGVAPMPILNNIGYFDIETSHLKADFGICLCYCIKDGQSDKILERTITKKEIGSCLDEEVIRQCVDDLKQFDRIVTYYGTRFDFPFTRTRAMEQGIDFPEYAELLHTDAYYIVRNKFALSSNRLENACRILLGHSEKTKIDRRHWIWALSGRQESLDYIVDHCRKDVTDLEKLYKKIVGFTMRSDRSA